MGLLTNATQLIGDQRPERIAILTGAGISAESGLSTFRGTGGYWKQRKVEDLASLEGFERDPAVVWTWYEERRASMLAAQPNAAHRDLATLESHPTGYCKVITQNIDMLHTRAGSNHVLELHGNAFRARCIREETIVAIPDPLPNLPPHCECGALLRPDVVWFGETLDARIVAMASTAVQMADLFLIIGTSGFVSPACEMVALARKAVIVEINPEETPISRAAHIALRLPAAEAVPAIVKAIHASRSRTD